MKSSKIFSIAILTFLPTSFTFPQDALKSGNNYLGGSISFSSISNTNSNSISENKITTTDYNISPSFGSFISDNLLITLNFTYRYTEMKNILSFHSLEIAPQNVNLSRRSFGVGPDLRYYFTGSNFIPFAEFGFNYSKDITNQKDGSIISFAAGINIFISRSAALEPFLSYSVSSYSNPDYDSNIFSVGIRVNYFIIN